MLTKVVLGHCGTLSNLRNVAGMCSGARDFVGLRRGEPVSVGKGKR
jgi:hypothetical protein